MSRYDEKGSGSVEFAIQRFALVGCAKTNATNGRNAKQPDGTLGARMTRSQS